MPKLGDGVRTTPTSLQLSDDLSFESWKQVGSSLCLVHKASAWWVGDWLRFGERSYGRRYKEAAEITGLDYQTLRNYAWVSSRLPMSRRRDKLSFQHHAEVASREPEDQEFWLSTAANLEWSRSEMRRRMKAGRQRMAAQAAATMRVISLTVAVERQALWLDAAKRSSLTLEEWILQCLDDAAAELGDVGATPLTHRPMALAATS